MSMTQSTFRAYLCEHPIEPREENGINCCEHCVDPPCVWVALLPPCRFYTREVDGYLKEHIKDVGYLRFLKACITGCVWQAKWFEGNDAYEGQICSYPDDYARVECWSPVAMPVTGGDNAGSCCWWGGGTEFSRACNPVEQQFFHVMWELEVTGASTATITLTPITGGSAVWESTDFNCDSTSDPATQGGHFTKVSFTENLRHLPDCFDVVPENTLNEPPLVCDTEQDQCDCCDNGADTASFYIEVTGCDNIAVSNYVESTRVCDSTTLTATYPGVTYPSPAPCCVWPIVLGTGPGCTAAGENWSGSVLVIFWCNGGTAQGTAYCQKQDGTWVSQGAITVTEFRCLDGCETFTVGDNEVTACCTWVTAFTVPELDCCCEGVQTNCCPDPIPSALTVTISAPGCTTLDGVSFQINHDSFPRWIGSTTNNGHTIQVTQGDATLFGDPYCPIALACDGVGVLNCQALPGTMSCNPFLHTATCTTTDPCGCTGTFDITITITE